MTHIFVSLAVLKILRGRSKLGIMRHVPKWALLVALTADMAARWWVTALEMARHGAAGSVH